MGIDLAWNTEKNSSAIAIATLDQGSLNIDTLLRCVEGLNNIINIIEQEPSLSGISIDAPLIINNTRGQRECEQQLNKKYRTYKAGCHPSNKTLYPNAASVRLSEYLLNQGFEHLGENQKWQIECYPHPAMVELFELDERLLYKKGPVEQKRQGQVRLAEMIKQLNINPNLSLTIADSVSSAVNSAKILNLHGRQIKENEDTLDAIICCYIAGCYAVDTNRQVFGDSINGYIYVPQLNQNSRD